MKALNISIRIRSLKILVHWSVWLWPLAALLIGVFTDNPAREIFLLRSAGLLFVTIFIHELAHWASALLVSGSAGRIILFGIGGMVHGKGICRLIRCGSPWKQVFVISTGCCANLSMAAGVFVLAYWQLVGAKSPPGNLRRIYNHKSDHRRTEIDSILPTRRW